MRAAGTTRGPPGSPSTWPTTHTEPPVGPAGPHPGPPRHCSHHPASTPATQGRGRWPHEDEAEAWVPPGRKGTLARPGWGGPGREEGRRGGLEVPLPQRSFAVPVNVALGTLMSCSRVHPVYQNSLTANNKR